MSDMPALPTIHVISDSMGNTAKTVARSAASHFGELDPNITVLPAGLLHAVFRLCQHGYSLVCRGLGW